MAFSASDGIGGAAQGASAGAQFGPWGAAIGGIVGGLTGGVFGGKRKAAMKRAMRAQKRIEAMQAFQNKVQTQRAYNAQRAEIVAQAGNEGQLGSSSVAGALSGFGSQLNAAFGFNAAVENNLRTIRKANSKAAKYGDALGTFNAITGAVAAYGSLKEPAAVQPLDTAQPPSPNSLNIQMPEQPSFFSGPQGPSVFSSNPVFKF